MIMENSNEGSPIAASCQIFLHPADLNNQKLTILRGQGLLDRSVEDLAKRMPGWLRMVIIQGACAMCCLFLWAIFA